MKSINLFWQYSGGDEARAFFLGQLLAENQSYLSLHD
jgi:hypothetical protein